MTSEVPEIKLAKLRVTALIEKIHCWSFIVLVNLYCSLMKRNSVTIKSNLFMLLSTGLQCLKETNQVDEFFVLFVKLYFSSTFNYVQLNYNFPDINVCSLHSALHFRLPRVSSRTHPKNSTNVVKKKVVRSWKGAPKKVPLTVKKNLEVESKKRKKIYDFRRTSTWNGKISDFCVYSRTYWRTT